MMTIFSPLRSWILSKTKVNTERQITVSGINIRVVRKAIKNLHLGVYPPDGNVRVAVPLRMADAAVRLAVVSKLGWIRKHQARFGNQERQTPREYVSGESHYFQGIRYRLNVSYQNATPKVAIINKTTIELRVRPGSTVHQREWVMLKWYRAELKKQIPALIAKWEPVMGVKVAEWGVKRMKTRWGSCNIRARRVWLNLALAGKSMHCLDYILVHEMVHLLERHHNAGFTAYMNKFVPQWKTLKTELNRAPLRYEAWKN